MLPLLATVITLYSIITINANFQCITVKSSVSGDQDDDRTFISCPSTHPTLVSCGVSTLDTAEKQLDGSYLSSDTNSCVAQNGYGGAGVYAHARCCKFPSNDTQCTQYQSHSFVDGDDEKVTTSCSEINYQYLTGCSAYSPWHSIDGMYPGITAPSSNSIQFNHDYPLTSHACTAVNGAHSGRYSGVKAELTCCNSPTYPLTCVKRFGTPAQISPVSCDAGWAMVGCSGYTAWNQMNGWYISGDVCYARSSTGALDVWSTAICCQIATDSPTTEPTLEPTTMEPTEKPTNAPNLDPTRAPTSECPALIVTVLSLDGQNITDSYFNGLYALDEGNPTFGQIDWIGTGSAQGAWIKYFGINWVISDIHHDDTLTHEKSNVNEHHPPIGTYQWAHSSTANGATVNIICSHTSQPTVPPTTAPTISPTHAPTTHFVGVYVTNNITNPTIYSSWFHRKTVTDSNGRSEFLYHDGIWTSNLKYDDNNGWVFTLFNHNSNKTTIYISDIHGYYPPTDQWVSFQNLRVYITGLISDWPTNAPTASPTTSTTSPPTLSPTFAPTQKPTDIPTMTPTYSPTAAPSSYPTPVCTTLEVSTPDGFAEDDIIANKILHWPFVYGGAINRYYSHWTFDCDTEIDEYTEACNQGYTGRIYYNGDGVWLISISSSKDDYYKDYMTHSETYYVPRSAIWTDTETKNGISAREYKFEIVCGAGLSPKPTTSAEAIPVSPTAAQSKSDGSDKGTDEWEWFSIILIGLLLVVVSGLIWLWWKGKKPAIVTFDGKDVIEMNEDLNDDDMHGVVLDDGGEEYLDNGVQFLSGGSANGNSKKKGKKIKSPKNNFVALESSDDGSAEEIAMVDGDGQATATR